MNILKWFSNFIVHQNHLKCFLKSKFQIPTSNLWSQISVCWESKKIKFYQGFQMIMGRKDPLEKEIATHSGTLAWKIPWMEEPGRLQSMGLPRVGHDWATSLSLFTFMHWRRKWQPTPVFLPGESQGRGSLVGCCLWGRTKSDTTEVT